MVLAAQQGDEAAMQDCLSKGANIEDSKKEVM